MKKVFSGENRLWEMNEECRELEEMGNVKIQELTPRVFCTRVSVNS